MVSTSLIGGYAFIRGISMYAGHFPNEFMLYEDLKNDVYKFEW